MKKYSNGETSARKSAEELMLGKEAAHQGYFARE